MKQAFTGILPQVSEILQNVNPQMLLILKTNDLVRSIEHTLRTGTGMGSFCVMSQCCVKSVYNKKYSDSQNRMEKIKISLAEFWALLKIRVYYMFLSFRQISANVFS